ncbi:hypothetical protein STRAU_7673 [Streptomyces aurantiacus JA 4570]|uniref:Uncharacterized protein n=1 Tax=Streptomyces aurantiacus JA 4570 TaxID=1286094 RepID=S3ZLV9_9ACTN|nr:hypothetical protein STRAU_7673 [Streptomyces aurantiacus JA 4570]
MKCVYVKIHLSVADGHSVASRMYFCDDASRTGKAHVGYGGSS